MSNVVDIINSIVDKKPLEFTQFYDAAMKARIGPAVEQKKYDLAASFFAGRPVEEKNVEISKEDIENFLESMIEEGYSDEQIADIFIEENLDESALAVIGSLAAAPAAAALGHYGMKKYLQWKDKKAEERQKAKRTSKKAHSLGVKAVKDELKKTT